jgi:hypothetical protein
LKAGSRYAIVVVAKDSRGSAQFENQGRSEIIIVDIASPEDDEEEDDLIVIGPPVDEGIFQLLPLSHMNGRLLYRFHEDAIGGILTGEPILMPFNSDNLLQLQAGNSLQNIGYEIGIGDPGAGIVPVDPGIGLGWTPPPPQYILPAGYNTSGGKPLKQAGIRFTARFAVGTKPKIEHPEDLEYVGMGSGLTVTGPMLAEPLTFNQDTKVIAATTTDDNGNYSVSFPADQTFGVLAIGPVTVDYGMGDLPMSKKGYGLYRVITMEVEEKWYCHPDIVIFLQPGQSLEVPTQVVKVQSYNLEVNVVSSEGFEQTVGDGDGIPNAVVMLGRKKHFHDTVPESFPKDEVKIEEYGHLGFGAPHQNTMVADSGRTNSSGFWTFRRLVKHSGIGGCSAPLGEGVMPGWPSDGYYLEAFSHPTEGDHNYSKSWDSQLAPCPARLAFSNIGCMDNECAPRSADYSPPTIKKELKLTPKWPKIYVLSRADYDGDRQPLPNTNLKVFAFEGNNYLGVEDYKTDAYGLFMKQFTSADIPGFLRRLTASQSPNNKSTITSSYVMTFSKPGFRNKPCGRCGSLGLFGGEFKPQFLKWGEVWDVDVELEPGSFVRGKVEDEHGQPIYGDVKIGYGPKVPLEMEFQSANQDEGPPFQISPVWMQQFGYQQHQGQVQMQQEAAQIQPVGNYTGSTDILQGGLPVTYQHGSLLKPNFKKVSVFRQAAEHGQQIPVFILPDASNYFPDTVYVDIPSGHEWPGFDLGTFVISEKLRRPRIFVYWGEIPIIDPNTLQVVGFEKSPLEGAEVLLSNLEAKTTNAQGITDIGKFGSPSNEFRLRVSKEGFIPYDQYVTIPATKINKPYLVEVELKPGKELTGTITRADGGEPIDGARVYTEVGHNDYGPVLIETFSDSTGQYQLSGLPDFVTIKVAKTDDPSVTYIGQSKQFTPQTSTLDFQLEEAPFLLTHIWNIPVDLESVSSSGNEWIISGAFVNLPPNERFKPENDNQRLPFKDVIVQASGPPDQSGKISVEPVSSSIGTTTTKFRSVLNESHVIEMKGSKSSGGMTYEDTYYGDMEYGSAEYGSLQESFIYNPNFPAISITKIQIVKSTDGNGHVRTRAYSLLEWFKFTYQYDGQFYLGETPENDVISAYKGTADVTMPGMYYLMTDNLWLTQITASTKPDFHVHNFPAVIDRYESYARQDSMVISTKLIVKLKKMNNPDELIVSTGDIIVLPEKIIVNEGKDASLEFYLETWRVKTGPWIFDENLGGIKTTGVISTNLLEFPAPEILIKPEDLKLPHAKDIDLKEITLAGVLNLAVDDDAKLIFDYIESPKHDPGVGHWRVQLTHKQSGQTVAAIKDLPKSVGWPDQTEVGIDFVENFSDGEIDAHVAYNQVVDHFNVLTHTVHNIYLYEDGVALFGNTDLGVPNLPQGYSARFIYSKEQNELKVRVLGLTTFLETKGKVWFQGDQQSARIFMGWDHFEVTGGLTIYDDQSPNDIKLRAKLIKKKAPTYSDYIGIKIIDVDAGGQLEGDIKQTIVLGGGQNGVKRVLQGEQVVVGNDWDLLSYQGKMEGFGGGFQSGGDVMWFEVTGAVVNDASKDETIQLTNIETPFGDIAIHLDFNEMAFVGALNVYNIPMGTVYIYQGAIEMRVGGLGFYLAGHLSATYPVIGLLNTNFIVGYYPVLGSQAKAILTKEMYIQKLPVFLEQSGIQGLYMSANKPFINTSWGPIIYPLGYIEIYANAGIDARFWFNFGDDYGGASLGGLAYAEFGIGGFVFPCEACAGILAELGFDVEFKWAPETDFSISACGAIGLYAFVCDLGYEEAARLDLAWSSSGGFDVGVTLGSTCSGNALKEDKGCK